jgi:membrane associated rhomboid family serine protease
MFKKPTPIVLGMLVTFVAIFVAAGIGVRVSPSAATLYASLRLDPELVLQGKQLWSLFTYALLHDMSSPFHLVFNGLTLYWFGPECETRWGKQRFVLFSLVAAIVGAVFVVVVAALGLSGTPVVGASAICSALVLSWGLANRDRQVNFFFFPMKGIHLVFLMIGLEILNAISFSGTSAAAHFGGMAVGYLLGDASPLRRWFLQRKLKSLQSQSVALRNVRLGKGEPALRVIEGGAGRKPRKEELN